MTGLPKKALDLLELGRANGWTVETTTFDDVPLGLGEAHGLGFLRVLEDGRDLFFVVGYGRRTGSRSWVALFDVDGYSVTAEVQEPTLDAFSMFGPDASWRWKAIRDLRWWLEHPDELVELWTSSGELPERKTFPRPAPREGEELVIEISLSGTVCSTALEAGWPEENPRGARALREGRRRRYGRSGSRTTAELERDDVEDLLDYLLSVLGALETCTAEELEEYGIRERIALRKATAYLAELLS